MSTSSSASAPRYQRIPLDFLGSEKEVLIVCNTKTFAKRAYTSPVAFETSKALLSVASPFFRDMFLVSSTATDEAQLIIFAEESANVVALVLSAALQIPHVYKPAVLLWNDLGLLFKLAAKWQLERARLVLFTYVLGSIGMGRFHIRKKDDALDLVEIFVEATREGNRALVTLSSLLTLQHAATGTVILLKPFELSQHQLMELGSERCSLLVDAMFNLLSKGVLKRNLSDHPAMNSTSDESTDHLS